MIQHHNTASKNLSRQPAVSLSIAFYNNLQVLKLVLASLKNQNLKNFEVILCDDGSNNEVVKKLHQLIESFSFPIQHLWHEDQGFRKNEIMNWGIVKARSDYMVFIDQDCILHPNFLLEHYTHQEEKTILAGRRMDLSPQISRTLTPEKIEEGYIEKNMWWILPAISWMKDNNGPKGIYIKSPGLRAWLNQKVRGVVGCNFSVQRKDLLLVNGFDQRYQGPGTGEDSDIEYRLHLAGLKTKPFCHAAVQYHVWHKLQNRPNENETIFKKVQELANSRAVVGISELKES